VDLVNLGAQLDQVGAALNFAAVRADPADLLIPQQAAPLPAYRLTWSERITQPKGEPR
jgi:type IV pilus biogenesis protein CpaD/CtpE